VGRGTDFQGLAFASATAVPHSREALVSDLRALGVRQGQTLLVHASLSAIGWVDGGPATVVAALHDSVGQTGTIVMATTNEENSKTSRAHRSLVAGKSPREVKEYRDRMPAFDRLLTPATGAGRIAEALRTTPGAVRSGHPQSSFAAIGARAVGLMAGHRLTSHLGEQSPLAAIYDVRDAAILMVGVGYARCSALHLAEYRYTDRPPMRVYECVVSTNGERHWTDYRDVVLDDEKFGLIGRHARVMVGGANGHVGNADCRLMPMGDVVDFATDWMARHRTLVLGPPASGPSRNNQNDLD
jgi:aminoglycoside 3-N-acetyltransferase